MTQLLGAWLKPVKDKLPADFGPEESEALYQAITQESLRRFDSFLKGLRFYQSHSSSRAETSEVQTLWEKGTTRLLDYAPSSGGPVIFVVPSLVNRFDILDIDPQHSFLGFLASVGLRPLVVDWQEPGEEEKGFSLSTYMTERLFPALIEAQRANGGRPCHLLGYCMGGVMALALAQLQPQAIRSLTLMATPWDFAPKGVGGVPASSTELGQAFLKQALSWEKALEEVGLLPPELLQTVFINFQSLSVLQKFMRFGDALMPDEARRFVLTEDWLNDGVPLSLPVARECLHDWYVQNAPAKGRWKLAGQKIDPSRINVPTYLMIPQRDKIVPPESALPLAATIPNATVHEPNMGHIGLMTGEEAPSKVWAPFAMWLYKQ